MPIPITVIVIAQTMRRLRSSRRCSVNVISFWSHSDSPSPVGRRRSSNQALATAVVVVVVACRRAPFHRLALRSSSRARSRRRRRPQPDRPRILFSRCPRLRASFGNLSAPKSRTAAPTTSAISIGLPNIVLKNLRLEALRPRLRAPHASRGAPQPTSQQHGCHCTIPLGSVHHHYFEKSLRVPGEPIGKGGKLGAGWAFAEAAEGQLCPLDVLGIASWVASNAPMRPMRAIRSAIAADSACSSSSASKNSSTRVRNSASPFFSAQNQGNGDLRSRRSLPTGLPSAASSDVMSSRSSIIWNAIP